MEPSQILSYQLPQSPDLTRRARSSGRRRTGLVVLAVTGVLALLAAALLVAVLAAGGATSQDTPSSPGPTASPPAAGAPAGMGGSPIPAVLPSASPATAR